ncbi:MAG: DUF2905 domain-containing protein [Chloroflexi bacterium]|nr:MAG: DUF2905 domain-containing protein [Chloroflexota bacterium]
MSGFESIGRLLLLSGAALFVLGLILIAAGRVGFPFGRLPGDIVYRRDNVTVYAPLVSCLVASVVLTLLLNLVFWLIRR